MLVILAHDNDVIMGAMAFQITSVTIVYSTVYSGEVKRKQQSSASVAFCAGNSPVTGEFPAQIASNAENVAIGRRHHDTMIQLVRAYMHHRFLNNGPSLCQTK